MSSAQYYLFIKLLMKFFFSQFRERVLDTVIQASRLNDKSSSHKIANVNLFLNALGLDASQLKV
jgi:hypothetical protein